MPVLHFERRKYRPDGFGGRDSERAPACGSSAASIKYTRAKASVTCKKCRCKLGLDGISAGAAPKMNGGRPTAWDHLDAPVMDDGQVEEVEVYEPEPVEALLDEPPILASLPPAPETPPPVLISTTPEQRMRHRVALIFFHLMRSHLGAEVVAQIAEMCAAGSMGPGREYDGDLMPRAERLADLVLSPDYEQTLAQRA